MSTSSSGHAKLFFSSVLYPCAPSIDIFYILAKIVRVVAGSLGQRVEPYGDFIPLSSRRWDPMHHHVASAAFLALTRRRVIIL